MTFLIIPRKDGVLATTTEEFGPRSPRPLKGVLEPVALPDGALGLHDTQVGLRHDSAQRFLVGQILGALAAAGSGPVDVAELLERRDGGLDGIVRVAAAQLLGENVADARALHHRTDRAARDAVPGDAGLEHDLARAKVASDSWTVLPTRGI